MKKLNGILLIAVHPGDILREMLDERTISQAQLARTVLWTRKEATMIRSNGVM